MLNSNSSSWNHLTLYKEIINIMWIINAKMEYFKPLNCVQK